MHMNITLAQRAEPSEDVLFQEVGGEAVLLDLATETYFGLDQVGTRFWTLLGQDTRLEHAFETMCQEYEVEAAVLEADLLALTRKLAEAGLVSVR